MSLANFTEADLAILRDVIAAAKRKQMNNEIVDADDVFPGKPEVYIAYPQSAISAAVLATGTSTERDQPGYGDCDIYQILGDNGNAELHPVGFKKVVYNLTESEITSGPISLKRDKYGKWIADVAGNASCQSRNEIIQLTVIGSPTGGTFDLTIDIDGGTGTAGETVTLNYNDTSSDVQTALEGHTDIVSGDVSVSGGPLPDATITIEFTGNLASTNIPIPTADWSSLTGGSGVAVIVSVDTQGYPN